MNKKLFLGILSVTMVAIGIVVGLYFTVDATAENLKVNYELNEQGQTYGHVDPLLSPTVQEFPQLIAAIGIDGTEGYVYADDLHGDQPNNEKEAIEYMNQLNAEIEKANKSQSEYLRFIPLYSEDGKTIIGQFGISMPNMDAIVEIHKP